MIMGFMFKVSVECKIKVIGPGSCYRWWFATVSVIAVEAVCFPGHFRMEKDIHFPKLTSDLH